MNVVGIELDGSIWRSRDGVRDVFVVCKYGWDGKGWVYNKLS